SGTSWKPSLRAASAGNSAVRSGVAVNSTLITSSVVSSLRSMTWVTSSVVPAMIESRSLASTWIAPRIARTMRFAPSLAGEPVRRRARAPASWVRLQLHRRVQFADLTQRQRPDRARLGAAQLHRAELDAGQVDHPVADLLQHAPHDVLAALVQHHLDQRLLAVLLHDPEVVGPGDAVLQLDALREPAGHVAPDRAGHLGPVLLLHPV